MKTKYLNLGLVFCLVLGSLLTAYPTYAKSTESPLTEGEPPEWPINGFWNDPEVPSIFDSITFGLYGYASAEWSCAWNFGDGTTSTDCFVYASKRYDADGDYTVSVRVTNTLGEVSSTSRVVSVRTHDVAITKFTAPQSASAGQTRQLGVNVRNTRYPEKVQVELYKNDMVWVGTLIQDVPPRSANRTTAFNFSYTFTAEDARNGKVTFRAMAFILSNDVCDSNFEECDDWRVDNYVTALPTRVSR